MADSDSTLGVEEIEYTHDQLQHRYQFYFHPEKITFKQIWENGWLGPELLIHPQGKQECISRAIIAIYKSTASGGTKMNDRMTGLVRMLVEGYENCVALEGELGKFIGYFRLKKAVAGVEEVLEFLRPYAPWPIVISDKSSASDDRILRKYQIANTSLRDILTQPTKSAQSALLPKPSAQDITEPATDPPKPKSSARSPCAKKSASKHTPPKSRTSEDPPSTKDKKRKRDTPDEDELGAPLVSPSDLLLPRASLPASPTTVKEPQISPTIAVKSTSKKKWATSLESDSCSTRQSKSKSPDINKERTSINLKSVDDLPEGCSLVPREDCKITVIIKSNEENGQESESLTREVSKVVEEKENAEEGRQKKRARGGDKCEGKNSKDNEIKEIMALDESPPSNISTDNGGSGNPASTGPEQHTPSTNPNTEIHQEAISADAIDGKSKMKNKRIKVKMPLKKQNPSNATPDRAVGPIIPPTPVSERDRFSPRSEHNEEGLDIIIDEKGLDPNSEALVRTDAGVDVVQLFGTWDKEDELLRQQQKQRLNAIKSHIHALVEENNVLRSERDTLQTANEKSKAGENYLNQNIQNLREALISLREINYNLTHENTQLKTSVTNLNQRLSTQQSLQDQSDLLRSVQTELRNAKTCLETLQSENQFLKDNSTKQLDSARTEAKIEYDALLRRCEKAEAEAEKARGDRDVAERMNFKLEGKLKEKERFAQELVKTREMERMILEKMVVSD